MVAAFGMLSRRWVVRVGLDQPRWLNIYFRLYALHELPHLLLLLAFALAMLWATARSRGAEVDQLSLDTGEGAPTLAQLGAVALVVTALGVATTHLVMHDLLFSMDEFTVDFQARIFARGQQEAAVPWPWRSIGPALTPTFVNFDSARGTWSSMYLPVYALLKAPFVAAGAGTLLNPLLTGLAVLVLGLAARRIWPDERLRPWVAVALLATSSEVIVTAGSGYTMPAHLLANIAWLWLALRGDRWSWAAALIVGALALGLHSPFPHALFVAPFLVRLLRERRWGRLGSAVLAYAAASAVWFVFLAHARSSVQGEASLLTLFALPDASTMLLHGMNLSLLFTWNAPVLAILALVVFLRLRQSPPVIVDLAVGVVLTLLFFVFFPRTQGHGWGYRYAFQVLGSLALIAADAVPQLVSAFGARSARRWLAGGLTLALVAQLPLRLVQTELFVSPFAAGVAFVRSRPEPIVVVHGDSLWYGDDLVRNDPYLARPIVLRRNSLSPGAIGQLERSFPGRVYELSDAELLRLGMTPSAQVLRFRR
ncbi:MAG TPA: hypothetical protein VF461_06720 [Gemmatimonadaceae bacterium]